MMKMNRWLMMAGMAAGLCLGGNQAQAQQDNGGGRPRFDPAQMMQRRMDALKEQMEVTDDGDWKALQPLIQKVMDAQMQNFRGMRPGFGGGPRRAGGDNADQGARRGGFGQPNPEVEALQKAIDGKASNTELKAAIAKLSESRKAKQSELEKAQAELRKVLSVRQEAIATINGLL
jgi:hypothetical protein